MSTLKININSLNKDPDHCYQLKEFDCIFDVYKIGLPYLASNEELQKRYKSFNYIQTYKDYLFENKKFYKKDININTEIITQSKGRTNREGVITKPKIIDVYDIFKDEIYQIKEIQDNRNLPLLVNTNY